LSEPHFRIRYRLTTPTGVALLVEDEAGRLLVCSPSGLYPYLREAGDPSVRDATIRDFGWVPVPRVAPYTLARLQRLLGTPTSRRAAS
jgi:hypothetical protein